MNLQRYIKPFVYAFVIMLGMFGASLVIAWTGPTQTAPNCTSGNPGCDAPLNISGSNQIKTGTITAGGLSAPTICLGSPAVCNSTWPSGGSSQWITSGSNIYYNTGNVMVGTNVSTNVLTVEKDQAASTRVDVTNTNAAGATGMGIFSDQGVA